MLPYQSRMLETKKGIHIHYIDEGTGPVFLMLHGNPTWSFLYRRLIADLRHEYRCIAPDYPGFGLSGASEKYDFTPRSHAHCLEQLILELDLNEITLMIHDWGGPIGLAIAERHPERFCALVIGNTWAWPLNGQLRFEGFSRFIGGPIGRMLIERLNVFVRLLLPAAIQRHPVAPEVIAAYRGPFATRAQRKPIHIFARELLESHWFLESVEKNLKVLEHLSTLIVWGEQDPAFRRRERRRFEQLFPSHHTVLLKAAGHFIQEDVPEELLKAIHGWCRDYRLQ
jgi:haloalkane dehalogenase